MQTLSKVLTSLKLTLALFTTIAISAATATFIENDYGTNTARVVIYNAKWFEIIIFLLFLNLLANIYKHKMLNLAKLPLLLFHCSIIFMIIGAFLTRYFGFEGLMHIREAKTSDTLVSHKTFVNINVQDKQKSFTKNLAFRPTLLTDNNFDFNFETSKGVLKISYKDFWANVYEQITDDSKGKPYIKLMINTGNTVEELDLFYGESKAIGDYYINFSSQAEYNIKAFNINYQNNKLTASSSEDLAFMVMKDQSTGLLKSKESFDLKRKTLYSLENLSIAIKDFKAKAISNFVKNKDIMAQEGISALIINARLIQGANQDLNASQDLKLLGGPNVRGVTQKINLDDLKITASFGAKTFRLPFSIRLNAFNLDRYAISNAPASYESFVSVLDGDHSFDTKIFMNNVLDYKGFRFYQSSYDSDEFGSILSVSKDPGKIPSYIGYFLLITGLLLMPFYKNSRINKLTQSIAKNSSLILLITFIASFQDLKASVVNKPIADDFSKLLVQDKYGKIKYINNLNRRLVNKLHRGNYKKLDHNQVILSMLAFPKQWQTKAFIKVKNKKLQKRLKLQNTYASFKDLFVVEDDRRYKLLEDSERALQKKPSQRNEYDKAILTIDEQASIIYGIFRGDYLRIYPEKNPIKDTKAWFNPNDARTMLPLEEANKIRIMTLAYLKSVIENNLSLATKVTADIRKYQNQYAAHYIPPQSLLDSESLLDSLNIFERLFPFYAVFGLLLFILIFTNILYFQDKYLKTFKIIARILFAIIAIGFAMHTLGLGLRWYVSGHAPWTNGYESMIYISWISIFAGLAFARATFLALSLACILSSITLMVAHLNWLDPEIGNLVPVLKSYWLSIHVSVIAGSYGFFGLSALIGFISLILITIRGQSSNIAFSISYCRQMNELAMLTGLMMLLIGNMMGSVWANESWGRYWSWDAKEVWTLISILVYTFIIHLKYLKLDNDLVFSALSVCAFYSILMTYFGVNYYLSGLHSYAAGDPFPIPKELYISIAVVVSLIITASFKYRSQKITSIS